MSPPARAAADADDGGDVCRTAFPGTGLMHVGAVLCRFCRSRCSRQRWSGRSRHECASGRMQSSRSCATQLQRRQHHNRVLGSDVARTYGENTVERTHGTHSRTHHRRRDIFCAQTCSAGSEPRDFPCGGSPLAARRTARASNDAQYVRRRLYANSTASSLAPFRDRHVHGGNSTADSNNNHSDVVSQREYNNNNDKNIL